MDLEERVLRLEEKYEKLHEDNIRNDEKYNTMLQLISNIQTTLNDAVTRLNKVATELAVNNHKTNKASGFMESFSYGKIITIIIGIATIIQLIKGG